MPRALQIYSQATTIRDFLKKIKAAHRTAASRGFMCQVLHYSASTKRLEPWLWPVYDGEGNPERQTSRVEPSGLVERGERRGAYAAECAEKRCGYIVYLDDFYTVLGLRMKKYARRETPLEFDQAFENEDRDQVDRGLLGLIAKLLESEGVDERRFWGSIKQCDQCRRIMQKRAYLKHRCRGQRQVVAQLSERWGKENVIDLTQED